MGGVRRAAAAIAALCVSIGAAIGVGSAQETAPDPAAIEPFLNGYVAAHMADQYPPAVMVAVATRERAFFTAYGVADWETRAPATTDTLFRVASVSKLFVWTSVMMLADEGKLDLDADVNQYLKTIRIPEAFGAPVTLNHLMTHRAGFEDTLGDFFEAKSGRTAEEALIRHMPKRVAPPGLRSSYSNWGTNLAAVIVETVSGVPFDEFVRTRILEPVGMDSTVLHDPASASGKAYNDPALDARIASPHEMKAGAPAVMPHNPLDPLYAAGAASFSARDAARWLQFFLNDASVRDETGEMRRLLSPEAFAVMRSREFDDRPLAPDFAHGFMEAEIAGHQTYGHGGTLSGFISDLRVVPSLGLAVFVSVNGAEAIRLPDLISRAVIEQFAGADPYAHPWTEEGSPEAVAAAKEVAGSYLGNRRLHSKLEKISALGSEISIAAEEDGSIVVTAAGTEKRYYPVGADVWTDRSRDRLFAYRDETGDVVRVSSSMGTNSYERVSFLGSSSAFFAGVGAVVALSLTALIGFWRRLGRDVPTSGTGRLIAAWHAVAALLWLGFAGVLAVATASLSDLQLADLVESGWPPKELLHAHWAATVAALAGALTVIGAVPALAASGWSIWRKTHYLLFAAAGAFAIFALYEWRLILAPMTTT